MIDRDPTGMALFTAIRFIFGEEWSCKLDLEDGSTAPFSGMAIVEAERLAGEVAETLAVASE